MIGSLTEFIILIRILQGCAQWLRISEVDTLKVNTLLITVKVKKKKLPNNFSCTLQGLRL